MARKRQTMLELDNLDRGLMRELQQDAYRTHAELARILGTSKTTITRRIQRLLREGVIRIVGVVDPEKIGFNTSALIGLDVDLHHFDSVIEQLMAKPQVHLLTVVTGRYDIVVGVTVATSKELAHFVRHEVATIEGVRNSETLLALEIKKQAGSFML